MRVLVIDTALGACTVGLFQDGRRLAVRSEVMARGHSERLGGVARDVAAEGGGFDGLDRIGVTVGPGSFTGLRVGLAFALGLGAALGRPVVGISTLQALAASIEDGDQGPVAAVIDARRGEVYLQTFSDGRPLTPAEALPLDAARARLTPDQDWRAVGSGAPLVVDADRVLGPENPTADALAILTARLEPERNPARPLYLRAPDATPPTRLPGQARTVADPAPR